MILSTVKKVNTYCNFNGSFPFILQFLYVILHFSRGTLLKEAGVGTGILWSSEKPEKPGRGKKNVWHGFDALA